MTDYTTGTGFHAGWAVTKMPTKQFSMGLVVYYCDQITGDSGPGARPGAFEGRAIALGGTVAYNFHLAGTQVSTRVKPYREFDVVNRLEGTAGYLTVAFPVTGGQMSRSNRQKRPSPPVVGGKGLPDAGAATRAGMDASDLGALVTGWIEAARPPRFDRSFEKK